VPLPAGAAEVDSRLRLTAVVGDGAIGGFALLNDWIASALPGIKAHDFAYSLGPVVVTPDEFAGGGPDWDALLAYASENTRLYPGDLLAGPVLERNGPFRAGDAVAVSLDGVGTLRNRIAG
jgi:hypothetical protein